MCEKHADKQADLVSHLMIRDIGKLNVPCLGIYVISNNVNISLSMPLRVTRTYTFRFLWIFYTSIPLRRNVSARISSRGLRSLIWVNTLRRVHTVGFLDLRPMCTCSAMLYSLKRCILYAGWSWSSLLVISAAWQSLYTWTFPRHGNLYILEHFHDMAISICLNILVWSDYVR